MTPARQARIAAAVRDVSPQRFRQYESAVQGMSDHEAELCANAARRRANGLTVTDQDQPEAAFGLFPDRPVEPPLALIGGMGPLAGAQAFRRACARFRNSRVVVLYQACSTPDRSTVILKEADPDSPGCRRLARRLAGAVRQAVRLAAPAGQPARAIIACNSAHYFWGLLEADLRHAESGLPCDVRLVSLVQSSIGALTSQPCGRALLLATEGARVGQVFSAPFRDAGIAFEEPPPALGRLLMRAIFEGTKSLHERRAVELGNEFFETILRTGLDCDCVVAGCTEVPIIIDLLRLRGSAAVAAFLSRVKIVDPLDEALSRA